MRHSLALTVVFLVGGCSFERATVVRNVGIGLAAEGALVTGGAFATRDSGEGISHAVITAAPLLATGIAAWVAGEILRGIAAPSK